MAKSRTSRVWSGRRARAALLVVIGVGASLLAPSTTVRAAVEPPSPGGSASADAGIGEPPAPTIAGLSVTAVAPPDFTITLDWTDASALETGFEVVRYRLVAGVWGELTDLGTSPADTTTLLDTVSVAGQYAYLVRAVNANGPSAWATGTLNVPDSPSVPALLAGVSVTATDPPVVTWTVPADPAAFGFEITRARNDAGVWDHWTTVVLDGSIGEYTDVGLADGLYAYLVRAYNGAGPGAWAFAGTVTISAATTVPATPTLAQPVATGSTVSLAWTDVATETWYTAQRARYLPQSQTWGEWTYTLHARDTTAATLSGVPDGQYAYVLTADNAIGASAPSIQQVTVSGATAPPDAPTALKATRTGPAVKVAWVDQSNGADNELYFDIQRAELVNGGWTNWVSFAADRDTNSYTDLAVPTGTYAYLVRAHNLLGDSDWAIYQVNVSNPPTTGSHAFLYVAPGYEYSRWNPCSPIDYVVNTSLVDAAHRDALFDAIDEVEAQTGLDFNFVGDTEVTGTVPPAGAEVIMSFTDQQLNGSNNVLGTAGGSYFLGGEVFVGRLRVRSDVAVGNTLRTVLLHELAHLVGLNHVNDITQIMYPIAGSLTEYQNGDREGLWWVGSVRSCYGAGAGTSGEPPLIGSVDEAFGG